MSENTNNVLGWGRPHCGGFGEAPPIHNFLPAGPSHRLSHRRTLFTTNVFPLWESEMDYLGTTKGNLQKFQSLVYFPTESNTDNGRIQVQLDMQCIFP